MILIDYEDLANNVYGVTEEWASCSTNGHLHFNSELLDFDEEVWDYVIVHELLHSSIPNHGKLWKSFMRAHLGDYEKAEEKLRQSSRVE